MKAQATERTDRVTTVNGGDMVMHAGRRVRVLDVDQVRRIAFLDLPVSNPDRTYELLEGDHFETLTRPSGWVWPNDWPVSTLHSLDCQCFTAH